MDDHLKSIIKYEIKKLKESAHQNGLNLSFSRNIYDFILIKFQTRIWSKIYFRRIVQKYISDTISKEIVSNAKITDFNVKYLKKEDKICVDF